MKNSLVLFLIFVAFCSTKGLAQKDSTERKNKLIGLPVAFFLPETNWGFGGLISYSFKPKLEADTSFDSQIQLGGAYTLNKQLLFYLPFKVFFDNNNYYAYGEVGYYLYNYDYFGSGNKGPDFAENFFVNFPRIQVNFMKRYDILGGLKGRKYLGVRYWFENYDVKSFEPGGRFDMGLVEGTTDNITSSIGLTYFRDSRDAVFFPTKGTFEQFSVQYDHPTFGSNYKYLRLAYDVVWYKQFKWGDILALNGYTVWNFGTVPFNRLASIGGTKRMRGFYEGRYRDNNLAMFQAAYRKHLFWRIGAEAFVGLGSVFPENGLDEIKYVRSTYGGGLRFTMDTERNINLRLDYGRSSDGGAFYVTIGEAF